MSTTFNVIYLGNFADIDTNEGNSFAENAAALVGQTAGSAGNPLYANVQSLSPGSTGYSDGTSFLYDQDEADTFSINGGPDQVFDAVADYEVTITYRDGTTDTDLVEIFQDTNGETYLAPETFSSSFSALEAGPIESITIDSLWSNFSGGMDADRLADGFAQVTVDGDETGETMGDGYSDSEGDAIGDGDDSIAGNGGDDSIDGAGGDDTIYGGTGADTISTGSGGGAAVSWTTVPEDGDLTGTTGADYFTVDPDEAETATIRFNNSAGSGDGDGVADYVRMESTDENTLLTIGDFDMGTDRIVLPEMYTGHAFSSGSGFYDVTITYANGNTQNFRLFTDDGFYDSSLVFTTTEPSGASTDDDLLEGGDDADTFIIEDGFGSDTIIGGEGGADADVLDVTTSPVTVSYTGDEAGTLTDGTDTLEFSEIEQVQLGGGNDSLDATADTAGVSVDGGGGADTIIGGTGDDTIRGGTGSDSLEGGAGADNIRAGMGADTVLGGLGNDTLYGGDSGADSVDGGAGDDSIEAGSGNDTLIGGADDDIFVIEDSDGTMTIDGGTGSDTVDFDNTGAAGVSVTHSGSGTGTFSFAGGSSGNFTGVEAFELSDGDDTVNASADTAGVTINDGAGGGDDSITTGSGADSISAGAGADTVEAGAGADTIAGGAGADSLSGEGGDDTFIIEDGFGSDTIIGGETDETSGDVLDLSGLTGSVTVTYTGDESGTVTDGTDTLSFSGIERVILTDQADSVDGTVLTSGQTIDAGDGNDTILLEGSDHSITGGAGDDSIELGERGTSATVHGGTGTDTLDWDDTTGTAGVDVTLSGSGDGSYAWSDASGSGDFSGIYRFNLTDQGDTVDASADTSGVYLNGGQGDDSLTGGTGDDILDGDEGNDTLAGGAGNDTLYADEGDDSLTGGTGEDRLFAGAGNDTLDAGAGNDYIQVDGDDGAATIDGGADQDTLDFESAVSGGVTVDYTGDGAGTYTMADGASGSFSNIEEAWGTEMDDSIDASASTAAVSIEGGDGADTLIGGSGDDSIGGDAGDDSVLGGQGNDTLRGDAGNDTLVGGAGDDSLLGGDDADTFILADGFGNDTIRGGSGGDDNDVLDLSALTAGVTVTYTGYEAGTVTDGTDTLSFEDIERIILGDQADVVDGSGDTSGIHVDGGGGNDTMSGHDGTNDTLIGGAGNDDIRGWWGDDSLVGGQGDDLLRGDSGNDTLEGGAGADTLGSWTGAASLDGGDDADTFNAYNSGVGSFNGVTVTGGEGGNDDDVLDLSALTGPVTVTYTGDEAGTVTDGTDTLTFSEIERVITTDQDDSVDGGASTADMAVEAGGGSDTVIGGSGNDSLTGGDGADTITGGSGADSLTGGTGNDTYAFADGTGRDTISDFDIGDDDANGTFNDQLDLSGITRPDGSPINAWDIVVTDDGSGNALLTFPRGDQLVLQGVTPAQMSNASQLHSAGVPCFTAGTMIDTPDGPQAVETLRPGDRIMTLDRGAQEVLWVAATTVPASALRQSDRLQPISIPEGAIGNANAILVSRQHCFLLGQEIGLPGEHLVRAVHLLRAGLAEQANESDAVTYVHILCRRHEIVFADGIATETFYPGPVGLKKLNHGSLEKLRDLFPNAGDGPPEEVFGPRARPLAEFRKLRWALKRSGLWPKDQAAAAAMQAARSATSNAGSLRSITSTTPYSGMRM